MRNDIPKVIGHRGAAGHAPENTLEGIQKAHELGCSWVELDCVLTEDKQIVLLHDEALNRTTTGSGSISATTLAALSELDAGSWFGPEYAGAKVPSLTHTFALLASLGMGANLEIKPATGFEAETGHAVAKAASEQWPDTLPPPVLSSFSLESLEAARETAPSLDRAILWWDIPSDWAYHQSRLKASAVHVHADKINSDWASAFKRADVPFRAYTIDDPIDADRVFKLGAAAIFTDYPDRFL